MRRDPDYADKAARIGRLPAIYANCCRTSSIALKDRVRANGRRLAFHAPCTLQHGQELSGVETQLAVLGFDVQVPAESHLCCGSAGTYSVLQPELATQLRDRKLAHLHPLGAECIVSANIGCIQHLQSGTAIPVRHWIEALDEALDES